MYAILLGIWYIWTSILRRREGLFCSSPRQSSPNHLESPRMMSSDVTQQILHNTAAGSPLSHGSQLRDQPPQQGANSSQKSIVRSAMIELVNAEINFDTSSLWTQDG